MSSIKTHKVCRKCFEETKDTVNTIRSVERKTDKVCPTCKKAWDCISVAFSQEDKKWYQIRERTQKSKNNICSAIASKKNCQKGESCVHAHNHLEKEAWDLEKGKRPSNKPKFYCYVCKINFHSERELQGHMHSAPHTRTTEKMRLLHTAGSIPQIRERPDLSIHASEHQLCPDAASGRRCVAQNACKFAHSEEERLAWNEALEAEREQGESGATESPLEGKGWGQEGDMRRDAAFMISKRTDDSLPTTPTKKKHRNKSKRNQTPDPSSPSGNPTHFSRPKYVPEFMKSLRRFIHKNGTHAVPPHINLQCNRELGVTIDPRDKSEVRWLFRFSSCQDEQIHAIILHNHKDKFRIGELTYGEPYGQRRQLQTKLYDNGTGCLLDLNIGKDAFLEVPVTFSPHEGEYKVLLVLQLMMSEVIAERIHVKVRDESFNAPNKLFDDWIDKEMKEIQPIPSQRCVLWEQRHKIIPYPVKTESKLSDMKSHEVPAKIESMIASDVYNKLGQEIMPDNYKKRFHDLLFLEEFDHKRRLVRYDLIDYVINSETAKKMLLFTDKESGMMKKAPKNYRYITFKLQYSLFEGYRSYKPPKQAYVIPNGSDTAYECSYVGRGGDEIHFMVSEAMVEECEKMGGTAQVRFAPDRSDYIRMHEALCKMELSVVFPRLKTTPIPWHWEEKSILGKAVGEKLSTSQLEGLLKIINTRFQTFPTLLCGPFGCGKTHTLAVAARLIALHYHGSTILIVAKNNSCANLYIEELSGSKRFDSISSYKTKLRGNAGDIGPILFRHFAKSAKLSKYKDMLEYTKYSKTTKKQDPELEYEQLTPKELEICGIIVTTTQGCFSLFELKAQLGKEDLFSHIFIDEAAQIIEPEACIPLHFAHANSKVVLAGDINQTHPLVLSELARRHGLDRTLLDRFYELKEYETELLGGCRVELRENFRSQEPIVRFLSKLFYDNSLKANPPKLTGPGKFPWMSMVHVNGEEERKEIDGFFSYLNKTEGEQTIKALRRFVGAGVDPGDIMVLSTYRWQLKLIEAYLVNERLENKYSKCLHKCSHKRDDSGELCKKYHCVNDKTIKCDRLGKIQGMEYDVLIINTVRTIHDTPADTAFESHLDLGLLDDPAQFNTILSRARGWVVVIGDTECLTSVGRCSEMWRQYIVACGEIGGYFPDGNIADKEHDELFQGGGGKQWAHVVAEQARERDRNKFNSETSEQPNSGTSQHTNQPNNGTSQHTPNINDKINKAKERKDQKKTLLLSFISTCKEELNDLNTTRHAISALSQQILLAKSALNELEKQYEDPPAPCTPSTPPTPPQPNSGRREHSNYSEERGATSTSYAGVAKTKPSPPTQQRQHQHHQQQQQHPWYNNNFHQGPNFADFPVASRLRFQAISDSYPFQRYQGPSFAPQRMTYPSLHVPPRHSYIPANLPRAYPSQQEETWGDWD